MGGDILPNSGNKFTGSKYVVAGVGLVTYKNSKNTIPSIRQNGRFIAINPSPTPTPSITPTNNPTPSITPTNTITPTMTPTPSPLPLNQFKFDASGLNSISINSLILTSIGGYVDWGDGDTTPITTLNGGYSHTYSTSYTGEILVNYYGAITQFNITSASPDTSTVLVVNTQEIANLTSLTSFSLFRGRMVGQMSDLTPLSLVQLNVKNDYTTSPNLTDLPQSLEQISLGSQGYTLITGDISVLSTFPLTNLTLFGSTTVYGDISTLPESMISINVSGSNTLSGDTSDLNFPNLNSLFLLGNNTLDGDVINLPNTMTTLTIGGYNTLYGSLSDFPSSIFVINMSTDGVLTGDLSDLPLNGYGVLSINGANTVIDANMATIPIVSGTTLSVRINGTLTGDIADLFIGGFDFPSCFCEFLASNASSVSLTYTPSTFPWGTVETQRFRIDSSTNLSSSVIDNLLIDMDSYGGGITWETVCSSNPPTITLNGTRTSASDAAVASLNSKGVTVSITP